jgi:hypothetical protein
MESVVRVHPCENYYLELEFDTGEVRLFDVSPYLEMGVFRRLKDQSLFAKAYVAFETVCWPGDIDIAPETLYCLSSPVAK